MLKHVEHLRTNHVKLSPNHHISYLTVLKVLSLVLVFLVVGAGVVLAQQERTRLLTQQAELESMQQKLMADLATTAQALSDLQAEDQVQRNKDLTAEINNIQKTFGQSVIAYEKVLDLQGDTTTAKIQPLNAKFSKILATLSKRDYASATAQLAQLNTDIATLQASLVAAEPPVAADLKVANTPPSSGYSRQVVETDVGRFQVDILTADLNSTRVVVETASAGDCGDGCPVSSLSDFVARAGGFAGINGPYFCPAEYPSCAGKTNSFDTLLMNKDKTYFNSDNNVYSTVPAMIFSGGSARLVGQSLEWGRDTGVDAVIASQPMLISGGNVAFGGDGDPKKGSRGNRSFIASKDNLVYIGVVRGATVAEVARVLKVLGVQSALNLDSGGSTAFMVNGRYVAGPGRNTPFGIVLVRR